MRLWGKEVLQLFDSSPYHSPQLSSPPSNCHSMCHSSSVIVSEIHRPALNLQSKLPLLHLVHPPLLTRAARLCIRLPARARDDILRRIPGLKDLDCQAIFGSGGAAKLSVNALWPGPVHKLLKHATAKYK